MPLPLAANLPLSLLITCHYLSSSRDMKPANILVDEKGQHILLCGEHAIYSQLLVASLNPGPHPSPNPSPKLSRCICRPPPLLLT